MENLRPTSSFVVHQVSMAFYHSKLHNVVTFTVSMNTIWWLIDSGTTDLIVHDFSILSTAFPVSHVTISLPNGKQAKVTHGRSVYLNKFITLKRVLCVFHVNLISAGKLIIDASCILTFTSNCCVSGSQFRENDWFC